MTRRALRISLFTYSTRPRGGVVHSLQLAEALVALGHHVHLFALAKPGRPGFFRSTAVPASFIPVEERDDEPLEERVLRYTDAYVRHLEREIAGGTRYDVYHAQDCLSANALLRLRDGGRVPAVVRTVHHVDDFTTPALVRCQRDSILRPDVRLVVSAYWQRRLAEEFGVGAHLVHNGVDRRRYTPPASAAERAAIRAALGVDASTVVLSVGGVEPRKNSIALLRAFARARPRLAKATGRQPLLVIAGGATLLDHHTYREAFEEELARLLREGVLEPSDLWRPGPVDDDTLLALYRAADVFAFPSVKEGWGLSVLEAQACGTPVVASDIPVFREYLVDGVNAVLVPPDDEGALGSALLRVVSDPALAARLREGGFATASQYDWRSSAERHVALYGELV